MPSQDSQKGAHFSLSFSHLLQLIENIIENACFNIRKPRKINYIPCHFRDIVNLSTSVMNQINQYLPIIFRTNPFRSA